MLYEVITAHATGYDPVANFHLSNGARLERVNPFADLSAARVEESRNNFV